jgi:hypothetical protein
MQKYKNSSINDLVCLIKESGWYVCHDRGFYFEFEKGDRILIVTQDQNDFTLICRNKNHPFENNIITKEYSLILPYLTRLPANVLYGLLHCYGIVSILALAESEGFTVSEAAAL